MLYKVKLPVEKIEVAESIMRGKPTAIVCRKNTASQN